MKYAFHQILQQAQQEANDASNVQHIAKELLHHKILWAISQSNVASEVTFQGGSAIRMFYGGQRYSEDLDFVVGAGENKQFLIDQVVELLREEISDRFGLDLEVKEPKNEFGDIGVKKWEFKFDIPGFNKKQVIKVEFCNVPSHEPTVKLLTSRYASLNDTQSSIMLRVESEREILADKMKAIVSRPFMKGRDLWDLKFLGDKGIATDFDMVMQKFKDYKNDNVGERIQEALGSLKSAEAPAQFMDEMKKFLAPTALKGLYLTDPPGIDFIKFAIVQMEALQAAYSKALEHPLEKGRPHTSDLTLG